jgi:diguanylate cyclase (GGDEF)-like protein
VVHEQKLSSVLRELARTLVTDFPIQVVLDRLVEGIVEALPVTAAEVTLISAGTAPHHIAASDDDAMRYERTFTFPLRHGDEPVGALNLYRDVAEELDPHDMDSAQTLADVAAAYLLNAQARTQMRASADRIRHDALHDPLTGLPNRLFLAQQLEHTGQRASRSRTSTAVLFADLDRFKQVNETHGHRVGDELLRVVARRLSSLVRPGDTLARVSADEFVFLCEELHSAADAEFLARRIDNAFATPFELTGKELTVTASVGMAFAGPGEDVSSRLVVKADIAMYQVKRKGGASHQVIDLRAVHESDDLADLERDLRTAFGAEKLDVAYQPIVNSADGVVTGVEALLRWGDPDYASVSPLAMVRVAEQTGLINDIGAWVLERACRDRVRWLHEHPDAPLDLAVNVSGRQLMEPDFAATVAAVLVQTGMDAGALVLEVTEDIVIEDSARSKRVLADLRDLGVRLALDDFGTGYSSLSYLSRLPVQIVKIDQSFIADIAKSTTGGAIVAAVTRLAHVLGLTVIAEGVETESQRDRVSAIGCEAAQGFFYARPMSAAAISSHLDAMPMGPHNGPAGPLRLPAGQLGAS